MNKAITSVLIILSLFFMATCGSESDHGSDTGAISFSLKWGNSTSSSSSPYATLSPSGDVCLDYGIDTISAKVYNSSSAEVASTSWNCSDHGGTISNVPTGSGMRVVIEGSISGSVMWSGQMTSISVTVGQTTQVGMVSMNHTSNTIPPSVSSTIPAAGATAVAINTFISVKFDDQMVWSSGGTPTFFTVNNGSVDISGTVTYNSSTYTVTFTPSSDLSYATPYTVTITSDVEDIGGNNMTGPYTWNFTTMPGLPDSGQIDDYTKTYGEDGDYRINSPSYTDNNNETVTDNITGLMWQRQDDDTPRSWDDGVTYCNDLVLAGLTNWRLPSRRELSNIVDFGTNTPAIDTTIFNGTDSNFYWSSDAPAATPTDRFAVNFSSGWSVHDDPSGINFPIRCVRGPQSPAPSFNDNGDGTVTDISTNLMWQQGEDGGSVTWENALTYCDKLSFLTYRDWRLPNVKELESIVDLTQSNPTINTTYFSIATSAPYWASTTTSSSNSSGWYVDFSNGLVDYDSLYKVDNSNVRCVRGGTGGDTLPVADASGDQRVASGTAVQLDGSGSSDPDGDSITYIWSFTSVPTGSIATFDDSTIVNPTFTVDVVGVYIISLVVNDSTLNSVADLVAVTAF